MSFGCLSMSPPPEHKPPNTESHHRSATHPHFSDSKSGPPIPSLNSAAKALISEEPFVESYVNRDYQFVFRSKPIQDCEYEPYKILLLIASAQGYHHKDEDHEDPKLSNEGVSICKIVSKALRKAKQSAPHVMYCSASYRALSTMQLICPDWYDDDVQSIIALDQLRPKYGKYKSNKRSSTSVLQRAFKNVSFKFGCFDVVFNALYTVICRHIDYKDDVLWNPHTLETDESYLQRIHEFLTKYLIPESELIKTQYGTLKDAQKTNVGWNDSMNSSSFQNDSFQKRIVVISHCEFFEYLMESVIDDISPSLMKEWKHGDLRKVFVYTKQQLQMNEIPYVSPFLYVENAKNRKHDKSMSEGDILMGLRKLEKHQFTLTNMSAAMMDNKHLK